MVYSQGVRVEVAKQRSPVSRPLIGWLGASIWKGLLEEIIRNFLGTEESFSVLFGSQFSESSWRALQTSQYCYRVTLVKLTFSRQARRSTPFGLDWTGLSTQFLLGRTFETLRICRSLLLCDWLVTLGLLFLCGAGLCALSPRLAVDYTASLSSSDISSIRWAL